MAISSLSQAAKPITLTSRRFTSSAGFGATFARAISARHTFSRSLAGFGSSLPRSASMFCAVTALVLAGPYLLEMSSAWRRTIPLYVGDFPLNQALFSMSRTSAAICPGFTGTLRWACSIGVMVMVMASARAQASMKCGWVSGRSGRRMPIAR